MNELVKIRDHNGKKAVSARDLYDMLGMDQKKWGRWYLKNIVNNTFAIQYEDWDYLTVIAGDQFPLSGNRTDSQDFTISINLAKKFSMMTRTEVGENVRQYFIEVEKEYKAITTPLISLDLYEAQLNSLKNS